MQAAEILRLVSGALQDLEPGIRARWEWNGGDNNAVRAARLPEPCAQGSGHAASGRHGRNRRHRAGVGHPAGHSRTEARREGARHAVYRSECERVRWKDGQADHGDHHGEHYGVGVDGHVRSRGPESSISPMTGWRTLCSTGCSPPCREECEAIANATWSGRAAAHRKPGRLSVSEGYVRSGACPPCPVRHPVRR